MEVKLAAYEGPLDLLLRLIERAEINIHDIPIAALTEQYLAVIRAFPPDMADRSAFILLAATLLEIKSRGLLPRPPRPEADEEDPRDALVRRLLELKASQSIAARLQAYPAPGSRLVRPGETELLARYAVPQQRETLLDIDLESLWALFQEVLSRQAARVDPVRAGYGDMPRERFTVAEKIAHMRSCLRTQGRFTLSDLLRACASRGEMVITFLAMLEMIRQGLLTARQDWLFKEIYCAGAEA